MAARPRDQRRKKKLVALQDSCFTPVWRSYDHNMKTASPCRLRNFRLKNTCAH
ncbi:hypothetical protein ABVT39_002536 [Epinephelus coioides]